MTMTAQTVIGQTLTLPTLEGGSIEYTLQGKDPSESVGRPTPSWP